MKYIIYAVVLCFFALRPLAAQERGYEKFKQLREELPTPNTYRNAAGAPGHAYWQQQADYEINVELDDEQQRIYGTQTITYRNNSPDALDYLWVQLDQNLFAPDSDAKKIQTQRMEDFRSAQDFERLEPSFEGGYNLDWVKDAKDQALAYTINKTMMRVDLPKPLKSGERFSFKVKWWYRINDGLTTRARTGYEYFPQDGNYAYYIAHFFPRMAVYSEVEGWQNKQFLGRGEFALPFGDYVVKITVPEDHVVAATGELQNAQEILSKEQRERLKKAETAKEPLFIITEEEARAAEKTKKKGKKTWVFKAQNVRDFAFASSRKFLWDAQGVKMEDGRTVMAMSFYPKEGNPLWERYSTRAVVHTLEVYSRHTFPYPYPVAISTHANFTGMEYPMICFNYGRPRPDGTYPEAIKYGMISVIIHEVGHNYFPMIVNSDERQWSWMDEGLNSFLQYLAECEWERDYPSRRGPAHKMVDYMKGDKKGLEPIMTNSESIIQFGNNAYGKPATALNILRETIMGRELFDFAFKTYSRRWMFKHPEPADFFRTMEDASGVDLDWFWRGWFFGIDHVDLALDEVKYYRLRRYDEGEAALEEVASEALDLPYISNRRNKETVKETVMERYPNLQDDYNRRREAMIEGRRKENKQMLDALPSVDKALLEADRHYYEIAFRNIGGLVMPLIVLFELEDGTERLVHIPVEIWRTEAELVHKVFVFDKAVKQIILDPYLETADTDRGNNYYPPRPQPSRFELYRRERR